ncbi:MAG: hypothetical protein R8G33_07590 [Gammaproteobacteria bacterium]|nr:hypothetical protein [Gammaproteobacteria bacterium]
MTLCAYALISHADSNIKPKEGQIFTSVGNWIVMLDYKQKAALTFVNPTKEASEKPQFDLSCFLPNKGSNYDMSLLRTGGFQTDDPQAVHIKVQVDSNSPFSLEWFHTKDRLITGSPSWLVKEMIEGKSINLKFRDRNGIQEYSYDVTGLGDALKLMHEACTYNYDNK